MPLFKVTFEASTIVEADDEMQAEDLVYSVSDDITDLLVKNVTQCDEKGEELDN